jgi:formate dehydrogenase major subunit
MNEIKLTLNGKEVRASKGEKILKVAERNGISIPTLCHDPRIEPYSSCFICVVEVDGMRGLQPSCSTPVNEGMVIATENNKIRKARKAALDLLLSNHYADCIGPCKHTCPAGVDVQGYVSLIEKGLYREAVALIKEANPLPAICGRVCVRPCEVACRRNLLDEGSGVGVDYMKRFAADRDLNDLQRYMPLTEPPTGKKVAIIGAGPGGLSAAWWLQQKGHQCDIFEAAPHPGGWLRYGIPEYRLPNDILDKEIAGITGIGVKIHCNSRLGGNVSFKNLNAQYDAFILSPGSQKGTRLGCDGDDALNVYPGIDFLKEMELTGKRHDFRGKTVAVVGGGNTAMDCCRTSIRCGADKVYVVYRRTEKEMPANPIEIHESKLEGVEYMFLTNPIRVNKDGNGKVKSMTLIRMALGEPDSSGRRRPVEVAGSEFDLEIDFILAAIGQKTELDFLDDVNQATGKGVLKANKWGDIDADPATLRTGVENIFAAGDSVSGPATIIEAVAQAQIAVHSCHNYLMGLPVVPPNKVFFSKKDNFKKQVSTEYSGKFIPQKRQEMPVLDQSSRMNFKEVELGYNDENVVRQEANRCLECGCSAFLDCDLQRYATEYKAEQGRFLGEFNAFDVDFSHPFIEFDRNKCILCGKCVRICREVVGANALGLVNRGFVTYVSPALDGSLTETNCETCGLCIAVCPTGAMMENYKFKPGPIEANPIKVIDFLASEGCEYELLDRSGFFMGTRGSKGMVNSDGNIGRQQKFGYNVLNGIDRIKKPLFKVDGKFREIGFDQALTMIAEKIKASKPDNNLFFAGARLTNEELYLIQKLARAGARTNNIGSFHYLGRGHGYMNSSDRNVPFTAFDESTSFYIIGADLSDDNQFTGFLVNGARYRKQIPVKLFTTLPESTMVHKSDEVTTIRSYYHFILAVNHYVVSNKLYNRMYIDDNCTDFEGYVTSLASKEFNALADASGVPAGTIAKFAEEYTSDINPVIIFSEKEICPDTAIEIRNLSMLAGKLGRRSAGIVCLKQHCNSQGLIDAGISPGRLPGNINISGSDSLAAAGKKWGTAGLTAEITGLKTKLTKGDFSNIFIFGEDPVGCAADPEKMAKQLSASEFMVVQDYFLTETARLADLVLPASYPFETGGSFTNSQRFLQKFDKQMAPVAGMDNLGQISSVLNQLGVESVATPDAVLDELFSFLKHEEAKESFTTTDGTGKPAMFVNSADALQNRFADYFKTEMTK